MKLNPTNNYIWLIILLLMFGFSALTGCNGSSTGPGQDSGDKEFIDRISGLMLVRGDKTTTTYSEWPVPEGEEPDVNTESINFLIKLKLNREKEDAIRIYGLEGADAGKFDYKVFPDCTHPDNCEVFGRMTGIQNFEVDLNNDGRTYKATGTVQTIDFEIEAEYQYQNITIHYDLIGERIID